MGNKTSSNEVSAAQPPISREVLLDTTLLPAKPTGRMEVRRITIRPSFAAGFHVHNGPVFGHILDGSVNFQIDGEEESILKAGDVFYEPEGVRVRFDATHEGVTFLGYFLLDEGQEPEIAFAAE